MSFSSATAGGFTERFTECFTGGASGGRRPAVVPGSAGASPSLLYSPTIVDAPVLTERSVGGLLTGTQLPRNLVVIIGGGNFTYDSPFMFKILLKCPDQTAEGPLLNGLWIGWRRCIRDFQYGFRLEFKWWFDFSTDHNDRLLDVAHFQLDRNA